ncbi:MAG: bifunctional riboflavin kinase/FAD synthetase [Lachnospiraceae bacterium]|nr:bifunctional riboflavin kinase/FAD synthetase [Lachnospiraceae bacterium]
MSLLLRIKKYTEYLPVQTAVTIGKFDGFHLGHQGLLKAVLQEKQHGYASCVVSFFSAVDTERSVIYTREEQRRLCEDMGIDILAEYPFDETIREMSAEQFVSEVLCKNLHAKVIVVGEDFRFGKGRAGDVLLLKSLEEQYHYRTISIPQITCAGIRISSTGIRELLAEGKIEEVNTLLGQPYTVFGEVMHGKKLGRTLGFPTLNLIPPKAKLLPAYGVYVTKTYVDEQWFYGITNIGLRPTVDSDKVITVETHLFQCNQDLYGKQIKVQFLHFLRPEQRFADAEELKKAISADFINAKAVLEKLGQIG